jgi:gliding motility-associated-like protein
MKQYYTQTPLSGLHLPIQSVGAKAVVALLLSFVFQFSQAQVGIVQNSNSQTLSQLLAGTGVTISNYSMSCHSSGSGTFSNTSSNLGLTGGVVLASGNINNIPNPATSFASTSHSLNGDAQLSTLTGGTIYDPCRLEFDIVPQGPLLRFNYVFASEEYPEWVCSNFNDVFGFFITGPNPGGGNYTNKNIAIIPNTNLPVAINTINAGTPGANAGGGTCNGTNQSLAHSSLYTNNLSAPVNPYIIYDAQTKVLQAIIAVVPCQSYHLKLAIADVADRIYDSGVFLEAYSFTSNPISVSAVSSLQYAGYSSAYEGCVNGTFTLTLSQVQQTDVFVNVAISGTATNGADYTTIPSVVMIPAGQTSIQIPLTPLQDGIAEANENVTLAVLDPCTGAVSSSASITISDNIPATINVADSTLCLGQSTQLTATGGVTYNWTPTTGLNNPNINNPIATPTTTTTYTANMQFGSCTRTVSKTIYVSNPAAAINANPAGTVCNGGSVVLTANPSAGISPYSYLWSTGAVSPSVTVASGGTYNVTATDSYGCSASATRNVTISNLNISGVATNVSCFGGNNGIVDITVSGSNAPFTYNWGGGIVSQDRTNVTAGTYTVTASNTVGCSVTATYTVTQPTSTLTTSATNTAVNCNGGNNGSINLTANGGYSPYSFVWSNGASTEDLNALVAGSYAVTVTDFNGCTATRTVNITQPTALIASTTQTNLNCNNGINGSITLTVSGAISPYTFAWSNGASTQNIAAIPSGTYIVTVADANGCTATRSATITQPSPIAITATSTNPSCNGNNNGSINITATGGTGTYSYNWGGGITTQNRTGLAIGTYNVTVTDANGCTASVTQTLMQPTTLGVTNTAVNISCNGGNNGTITTTTTGGTTPYAYNWGGGITTANRSGLTAGTYTLTVTDANGCSATTSNTITQPTTLLLSRTITNANCNGGNNGAIQLTANGGVSPYSFNWGGGVTTKDRNSLGAGTYTVTVTDANNCTATISSTITQPAALTIGFTSSNVVCNGLNTGAINSNISGGSTPYTYLWSNGTTTQNITGITAGTYSLTVTDNNGCTATNSRTITQPTLISISETVTDATCAPGNNGAINITVNGGTGSYTYNWGGGITTQNRSNLFAGTYTVTATDASGCSVAEAIAVSQLGTSMNLTASATAITCAGTNNGAIDVTLTGGTAPIAYNWGGGITTEDRTGLAPGNYSVTVTDGLSCSAVLSQNITAPSAISITATPTNINCFGASTGTINTNATGGTGTLTYNWGGGITTPSRTNLSSGTYIVTVTDANSCTATSSIALSQPAAPIAANGTPVAVSCFGGNNGSINTTISGGTAPYTYLWSNGNITANNSNVVAGNYTVTITDANGCTTTTSNTITQPTAAINISANITSVNCFNGNSGSIDITTTGGTSPYTFNWGGGITTEDRTTLSAGIYTITVTDFNGCSATSSATITQPSAITATSIATAVSCNGGNNGTIDLTTSGGIGTTTFNWGGGITTEDRTALSPGAYTVTITDANGCSISHTATITQPTLLTLTVNSGNSVCLNPTGTASTVTNNSGTAPYTYLWSNNATTQSLTGLAPSSVSVSVTDANGCSASGTATVGLSGNNTNANFTNTGTLCGPNASIVFTHTGSANLTGHFWDFGNGATSTANNPTYVYPTSGTFTITHIVQRGFCYDTLTRTITIQPRPIITPSATNVSCYGANNGAINLNISSGQLAYTYNWGGGVTSQNRTGLAPGTYTVTVTDQSPCSASASIAITQPTILQITNTTTIIDCPSGNNGAIDLTVSGGTPSYVYNWSNGATTQDINGLTSANYTVTIIDNNICTSTATIFVYAPNAINIAAVATPATCTGINNGSISANVTGGNSSYTYNWSTGATTQTITNLAAASYAVTVTDNKSCTATATALVTQPTSLAASLSHTNVGCFSGSNGSITSTITGGTAPYNYVWNDGNTDANRSLVTAGNFTLTVTDFNGCSVTATTIVTQPSTAVALNTPTTNSLSCYGNNNGTISIAANGGTPSYSYLWSDGASAQNRTNMLGGTYFVTATDQNGCVATASATINQPNLPLSIDTILSTTVNCFGNATGTLNANVSGGTSPYTYLWNNGPTSANQTAVSAGTYTLTVTDNNGCSTTSVATVSQPAAAITASSVQTNVSCNSGTDGAINLTATGGTSPYTFTWSNGATTEDIATLTAGVYNVTITDSLSCTFSTTATITQPTALAASGAINDVNCFGGNDGSIAVTASGGTSPYTYLWNNAETTSSINGLTIGNYNMTVTDHNNCTAAYTGAVNQPAQLVASTVVVDVSCNNGTNGNVTITVTGGILPYSFAWNSGINAPTVNNLTAGNYSVTVQDIHSCTTTINFMVNQPNPIVITEAVTPVACNGNNTGAIDVTVGGGTGAYTYVWSNSATTQDLTNLPAGNYTLTVTDANNCNHQSSVAIVQPTALTTTVVTTPVNCFNQATGAIDLTVNGGTPNYNFNWGSVTTEDRTSLSAGTYTVTITDGNNCTTTQTATITQPAAALQSTLSTANVNCFNGNNGAITVNTTGGTSPYSYLWQDGNTNANRSALIAGNYTLTVTDAANCSFTSSATITQPSAVLSLSVSTIANISCFGGNNGAINLFVSGGTSPYSFVWNDNATTLNRTNLTAGNYSTTVTDNNGCTATTSTALTQPNAALATTSLITSVSCFGGNNGAINLTTTGGTSPYLFNWSNTATSEDITSLSQGNYTVTITDANSCSLTASYNVTQPTALTLSETHTNVLCFGGNNASINLNTTGGTTPYNFVWSNGATTEDINNLQVGNYIVTVQDANTCTAIISANITEPTALLVAETHTAVSCFGGNNGAINIATSGGTSPYVFNWSNGATTANLISLVAGNYTLTVNDNNNCSVVTNVAITQPTLLTTALSTTNILCHAATTGAVDLSVNGGTVPYVFNWSNAATTEDLTNLPIGTYSVTVSDANNCTATNSTSLTQPSAIIATETHIDVLCNGAATGIIDITANGGIGNLSYAWSNGDNAQDISGVQAGNYNVTITDANACTIQQNITIQQPTPFTVGLQYTNISCNGGNDGSINLTVSGATTPYTFNWNNGASTEDLNNVIAGNYFVIINDANNCVANANITLTQPNSLSVTMTQTNVSCFNGTNGSIDISTVGGTFPFTYSWNDGATTQDRNNLSAGTYQVTVNDNNSCAVSTPIIITQPNALALSLQTTNATCYGFSNGNVTTQISGGTMPYSYNWSNGNGVQNLNNVVAGTYSLTVTDNQNCSVSSMATINEPAALVIAATSANVSCFNGNNGQINVTATGGTNPYQYVWNGGGNTATASNLQFGNYTVTLTDANNCLATQNWTITQPTQLQLSLAASNPLCHGTSTGQINLTVNGGTPNYSYLWNNGGTVQSPTTLAAGTHTVSVTDNNGCSATASAQLAAPNAIAATPIVNTPSCFGGNNGNIQLNVAGGSPAYQFNWSNGATTQNISGLTAGNFTVTITDANLCQEIVQGITVANPTAIAVNLQITDVACGGTSTGSITSQVSGGTGTYGFNWSNGSTGNQIANQPTGNYSLTVTDANGCSQTATGFVNTLPQLAITSQIDQLVCVQDQGGIDITASGGTAPFAYKWNTGSTSEDLNNIQPGNYNVLITDANGCTISETFQVINTNSFSVEATGSTTITMGETATLNAVATGSNQTTYNWTPNINHTCSNCPNTVVQPGSTTLYTVIATDTNGCIAQDTVSIKVIADYNIFTPNAFTPNGDGNNDYLQIFGNLAGVKKFDLMIFNRWGEKVYETTDVNFQWDGTFKGALIEPSVLVYVMKIVHLDGYNQKVFKGSITILR